MEATIRREKETPMHDLGVTTSRAEAMGEAEAKGNGQNLRAKLEMAVEKAKAACERLQNQTAAAAKATDKTIREHPYQFMGIAFGLGVVLGAVLMRKQRR